MSWFLVFSAEIAFLMWCFLKIDSYIFAIKPFGFSVLAANENESAESFDTNVMLQLLIFKGTTFLI